MHLTSVLKQEKLWQVFMVACGNAGIIRLPAHVGTEWVVRVKPPEITPHLKYS